MITTSVSSTSAGILGFKNALIKEDFPALTAPTIATLNLVLKSPFGMGDVLGVGYNREENPVDEEEEEEYGEE